MKTIFVAVLAAAALGPSLARAQYGGYPYYGYHSSTAQEGYSRGLADVIRSQGLYNQLSADAAVRWEDARRKHIENYQLAVETYFQVRDLSQARRTAQRAARHDRRIQWLQSRKPYRPPRLNDDQFNRSSGEINWPAVLRDEAFSPQRNTLEKYAVEHALLGGIFSIDARKEIRTTTDEILNTLKQRRDDVQPRDSIVARHFIEGFLAEIFMPR
ncbi:MAG: hypothetical protein ACC628_06495 [Pirellulaceae bacterium]